MYRITITFCFISLLFISTVIAQKHNFGDVSEAEVASKMDSNFPDANAVVLYRYVNSYLGNYVEVYERIKIYNEEGYDNAIIIIPYPDVTKVKGATYNMVNGQMVKTKLDKDLIFTDEIIKGVDIKKFTFPNVSPGSVLELSYRSTKATGADIDLQYDIPIKRISIKITNRSQIGIEILQNPRAFLKVNRNENGGVTLISASNVDALEPENYVYDMEMYRSYLKINTISVTNSFQFGNWKKLVELIMDINDFTYAFKPKNTYKDEVARIIGGEVDRREQVKQIYNYLREEMKWDDSYGIIPDQTIKETFKKKEGSMADINAVFISMLESIDITANPVLVSTKLNGIPLTASLSAFNGLIAGVKFDDEIELFDVVGDRSSFNLLDQSLLNWQGIHINKKDKTFSWVNLTVTDLSVKSIIASATIDEDLFISGKAKERNGGYYSAIKKYQLKDLGEDEMEDILNYDTEGLEITEIKASIKEKVTDVNYEFEIENAIDEIDGKMYFSPLLFFALSENPFQKNKRNYPIDFEFTFKKQLMINLEFPENYKVESLPKATKIVLPDGNGSFTYRITSNGNTIQVSTIFQINESVFPYDKYEILKEFFKVRIAKEKEKIVLSKI